MNGRVWVLLWTSLGPLAGEAPPERCEAVSAAELTHYAKHLSNAMAQKTADTLCSEVRRERLDPLLIIALIDVESTFDATAVSALGAQGLMQILPATAVDIGRQCGIALSTPVALEPALNVKLGIRYLAQLRTEFGVLNHALLAYNIGPPAMRARLRREGTTYDARTTKFVARVWRYQQALQKRHPNLEMSSDDDEPVPKGR